MSTTRNHYEENERTDQLARHILCDFRQEVMEVLDELKQTLALSREELTALKKVVAGAINVEINTKPQQAFYSTAETGVLLDKRTYTVREWCRLQRIHASKRPTGRGDSLAWEISQEEIQRIREHGLLPIPERY